MCTHTHMYIILSRIIVRKQISLKKKNSSKINRFVLLPTGRFHVNRRRRRPAIYTDQLFVGVFFFIQNVFLIIIHCRLR